MNLPPAPVTFEVGNHRSKVLFAPPALQWELYRRFAYPTETAKALASGWRPPEAQHGEAYWDGWVRFSRWYPNGTGTISTGLVPEALQIATQMGLQIHVTDERRRPEPGVPDFPAPPLREYQARAAQAAIDAGRGVLDAPPRSGKTRIGVEFVRSLFLPTTWIAPVTNIVEQTVRVFHDLCGRNFAAQVVGNRWRDVEHTRVHVCTAATAASFPVEYWRTRDVLVIDEVHHGAAQSYHVISERAENVYYRLGMTGTFGRSGNDDVALRALLSNVIFRITTTQLVEMGHLVPSVVGIVPVDTEELKASGGRTWHLGAGRGVFRNDYRHELVAWLATALHQRGLQTLVLVGTKAQGQAILKILRDHVSGTPGAEFRGAEFVSTDRPPDVCRRAIDAFINREVRVLVGTSMVGEGTDLPTAEALVFAPGGKAEISHKQSWFRVCTAAPGKRAAVVVDLADRHHKTLMTHSLERASTYLDEPTATVHALSRAEDFPAWLDWVATTRL